MGLQLTVGASPALRYIDGAVEIGHDARTGDPIDYVAHQPGHARVCNGIITGQAGSTATTLARRIADTLDRHGWDIRHVDGNSPGAALTALFDAERYVDHRDAGDQFLLLVWDRWERLAHDRALQRAHFVERVADLARGGPCYGVAQLVVTESALPGDFGHGSGLLASLCDNAVQLHDTSGRTAWPEFGLTPGQLPAEPGHALVAIPTHDGSDFVHTHLDDGRPASECAACQRDAYRAVTR